MVLWCHVDGVNLRNPISGFLLPPFRSKNISPCVPFTRLMSQQSRKVEGKSGELAEPDELAFGRAAAQIAAAEMGVKINFKTNEEVTAATPFRCRETEKLWGLGN